MDEDGVLDPFPPLCRLIASVEGNVGLGPEDKEDEGLEAFAMGVSSEESERAEAERERERPFEPAFEFETEAATDGVGVEQSFDGVFGCEPGSPRRCFW